MSARDASGASRADGAPDEPEPLDLSARARHDLPWSARSFTGWLRARLIEHWQGECCWHELDRGDFGVLRRPVHPNRVLVADVVALLTCGAENLTVITWALETDQSLEDVVTILTRLDVNSRHAPRFLWLLAPPPMDRLVAAS
ncbi:MAG: hypothetical protein ABIR79_19610 [Candidatus Binatia bacterium]